MNQKSAIEKIPVDLFKVLLSKLPLLEIIKLRLLNRLLKEKSNVYLNDLQIKQIACGRHHTVILLNNGRLLGIGSNSDGQLGLDITTKEVSLPTEITTYESIQEITAHGNTTICRTENGEVWVLGRNKDLGLNSACPENFFSLQRLPHIKNATGLISHDTLTAVLTSDNRVNWWLGSNNYKLAIYSLPNEQKRFLSSRFTLPDTLTIKDIATSEYHALVLTEDDLVYGTGEDNGKLGLGLENTEENVWYLLLDGKKARNIHATNDSSYILTFENELYVGGDNRNAQLGSSASTISKFKPIPGPRNINFFAANTQHTFISTDKNQLLALGENQYGELGIPVSKNKSPSPFNDFFSFFGIPQNKSWQHITERKPKLVSGFFALKNELEKSSCPAPACAGVNSSGTQLS